MVFIVLDGVSSDDLTLLLYKDFQLKKWLCSVIYISMTHPRILVNSSSSNEPHVSGANDVRFVSRVFVNVFTGA